MNNIKKIYIYIFVILFTIFNCKLGSAQCIVNAGGGKTICGTSYIVTDASANSDTNLVWTVVSTPNGASNPIISNGYTLTPTFEGLNKPGEYKFRLTKKCDNGKEVTSEMSLISTGDTSTFTAGNDITNVLATTGTVNLQGVIPEGFTGIWRAENIFEYERFGRRNSKNAEFSDASNATAEFRLIKKANHDVDPAYRLYLKITSIYNPNCFYEKSIVVRFIPNPKIVVVSGEACGDFVSNENSRLTIDLSKGPTFSTTQENVSGNSKFGTKITLNPIEQPPGGGLSFVSLDDDNNLFFKTGPIGVYVFTLTIENASGSYTTNRITYNKKGISPGPINFLFSAHPKQNMVYSGGGSGGEVHCNFEGKTTPLKVYFSINDKDDPVSTLAKVTVANPIPPGGAPNVEVFGSGQKERYFIATPPSGGWRVGTYRFSFSIKNGDCSISVSYYIHISDGQRENLKFNDVVVCYPGTGKVNATIDLPNVFQEVINSSYFAGYTGVYKFTRISKPEGASEPIFQDYQFRNIKNAETIISDLDKPGVYVFKVKAEGYIDQVDWLIEQEYACSNAMRETTFKVIVSEQINANAGSNQNDIFCRTKTVLVGNSTGDIGIGKWTVVAAPEEATPVFDDNTSARTIVDGLDKTGEYKFRWTIKTGDCISSSDVDVIVDLDNCKPPKIITNPMISTKTKRR